MQWPDDDNVKNSLIEIPWFTVQEVDSTYCVPKQSSLFAHRILIWKAMALKSGLELKIQEDVFAKINEANKSQTQVQ